MSFFDVWKPMSHSPRPGEMLPPMSVSSASDWLIGTPHAAGSGGRAVLQPAWLRHVDPEARGLHEAVVGAVARVAARERERLRDRALGVHLERRHAGVAEHG